MPIDDWIMAYARLDVWRTVRRGFTFVEVMIVVVIVGILAAIVVPQFGGVSDDARASALQGSLGGVRSSIAGYRAKQVIAGAEPFPSVAQLTANGTVLQGEAPVNPFNQQSAIQGVTRAQAEARAVLNEQAFGWNYFVDNTSTPPVAIFYANSGQETTATDGQGAFLPANRL